MLTAEDIKAIAERVYPGAVCAPVIDEFVSGKVEISGMVAYPKKAPFRFFPKLDGTDQQRLQALDVLVAALRCQSEVGLVRSSTVKTEQFRFILFEGRIIYSNDILTAALLAIREATK